MRLQVLPGRSLQFQVPKFDVSAYCEQYSDIIFNTRPRSQGYYYGLVVHTNHHSDLVSGMQI